MNANPIVKIRAISHIKLETELFRLDFKYPAGSSVDDLARDVMHAMIQNLGTQGVKSWFENFIKEYKPDYPGLTRLNDGEKQN